jgi:hypothetical protein
MRQSTEQRRLLAVLVADIVGYSRLMAENEADTFYRVQDLQSSLITPTTERNHGRVVKWTGDGFIGTFDSAVDAVRAAIELQSGVAAAGASSAEDRRIRFRIGSNTGDVIIVPGDVYGDTVNVAARLEALAEPGGICISTGYETLCLHCRIRKPRRAHSQEHPDPVGSFNVIFDPIAWTMAAHGAGNRRGNPRTAAAAPVLLVAAATGLAGISWAIRVIHHRPPHPPENRPLPTPSHGSAGLTTASWREELSLRIASAVPSLRAPALEKEAGAYEAAQGHKAQAASLDPPGLWRSAGRPTVENAETSALENCQIRYGQPCALLAVDEALQMMPSDHSWPRRDMPRARYSGNFDPAQIPGSPPAIRERSDIFNYRAAPAAKAAAFTPAGGRMFTILGAANQRTAEEEALKACIADPVRKAENGPCFLYATGDRVVLPLRLGEPLSEPSAVATAPSLSEALSARLASAVPKLTEKQRGAGAITRRPRATRLRLRRLTRLGRGARRCDPLPRMPRQRPWSSVRCSMASLAYCLR